MEKEILEGNKLIKEFYTNEHIRGQFGRILSADEYKYHFSWDWLMPVVDKIMDIDITPAPQWTGYRMEIVPRGYVKLSGFPMHTITTNVSIEGSLIKAVWKAAVQFIHFYNTQSK